MSKVVFYGLPLYAHSIQTFPLLKELIDRGEEVIYYTNSTFRDKVKMVGAEYREYLEEYVEDPGDMFWNFHHFIPKIREIIQQEMVNLGEIQPDYLILDRGALWGPFLANSFNLRTVCLSTSITHNKEVGKLFPQKDWMKFQRRKLRNISQIYKSLSSVIQIKRIKKEFDFDGDTNPVISSDLVLIHSSRSYQPMVDSVDERYKFIGWLPSIQFRNADESFNQINVNGGELIYISLGTTFNRDSNFFEICIEAFKDKECQVIISTGKGKHISLPDNIPGNIIIREWVPQMDILKKANVFITQGGTSSISESFYFGCPVVVVPKAGDQFINGYRVEQLGIGKNIRFGDITPGALRTAVESVLADPQYRQNSIRIGDSLRAAGGAKIGVDEIIKFKEAYGVP